MEVDSDNISPIGRQENIDLNEVSLPEVELSFADDGNVVAEVDRFQNLLTFLYKTLFLL